MDYDLSNVGVGDWICTTEKGWEEVVNIDRKSSYPIETKSEEYTFEGKLSKNDKYPSAYLVSPREWNAGKAPCIFKNGEPVLVSETGKRWYKRYFSHMKDGKFWTFSDGLTEWTSQGRTSAWCRCKRAQDGM